MLGEDHTHNFSEYRLQKQVFVIRNVFIGSQITISFCSHPAPSSPPQNLTATVLGPTSISLAWSPPPPHNQNGNIREYRINMTEVETGRDLNYSTAATSYTVPLLHPYYTYECIVSAYTVATGPFAEVTVMTQEDSKISNCNLQ